MPSDADISRLLSELTKLTAKGELHWSLTSPPDIAVRGTDYVYPLYFDTSYRKQRLGIGQRRLFEYDPQSDERTWDQQVVLLFVDKHGRVIWEITQPYSALHNLFRAVREKAVNIDGIVSDLLAPDADDKSAG